MPMRFELLICGPSPIDSTSGKARMSKRASINLAFTGVSSLEVADDAAMRSSDFRLLRRLLSERAIYTWTSLQRLKVFAHALAKQAETAYLNRDLTLLEEASTLLRLIPLRGARSIGLYYGSLALDRRGELERAQTGYELTQASSSGAYKARAIQSLGTLALSLGRVDDSAALLLAALSAATPAGDLLTHLMAQMNLCALKSTLGDHIGALKSLESIAKLTTDLRNVYPVCFYSYHNALAVELGELGRLNEAKAALAVALASPFASAYPEWNETRLELEARRTAATHSIVAVHLPADPLVEGQVHPIPDRSESARSIAKVQTRPSGCSSDRSLIASITIHCSETSKSAVPFTPRIVLERLDESIQPRAPPNLP